MSETVIKFIILSGQKIRSRIFSSGLVEILAGLGR